MNHRRNRLRWALVLGGCAVVASIGRHHFRGGVGLLFAIAAGLLLLIKFVQGGLGALRRVQEANAQSCSKGDLFKATIPPWIRGVARVEKLIYSETTCRIFRKVPPSAKLADKLPEGEKFSLSQGPISPLLVPLTIIALLSDIPLTQVIIAIWNPPHAHTFHIALLILALWAVIWVIGDRFSVAELRHVVSPSKVTLRVGYRWYCDIPIGIISGCYILNGKPRKWLSGSCIERHDVWMVTPIDSPRVMIELRPEVRDRVVVENMGTRVTGKKFIAVYVDNPEQFASAILKGMRPKVSQ